MHIIEPHPSHIHRIAYLDIHISAYEYLSKTLNFPRQTHHKFNISTYLNIHISQYSNVPGRCISNRISRTESNQPTKQNPFLRIYSSHVYEGESPERIRNITTKEERNRNTNKISQKRIVTFQRLTKKFIFLEKNILQAPADTCQT